MRIRSGTREHQPDGQATERAGGDAERAAVALHDRPRDGETEAGAAAGPTARRLHAVEPLGEPRELVSGNAGRAVLPVDHRAIAVRLHGDGDATGRVGV